MNRNLSQAQFMPVVDLMNMHSHEALRLERKRAIINDTRNGTDTAYAVKHGPDTRFKNSDLFLHKQNEINSNPAYAQLDEPIRNGSIDPVMLQHSRESDVDEIYEGHHRIVQAHMRGVQQLPVTYGGHDTQKHYDEWDGD